MGPHAQPVAHLRTGEARHPGPGAQPTSGVSQPDGRIDFLNLETINISSLARTEGLLKEMASDVVIIQEHPTREGAAQAYAAIFAQDHRFLHCGPVAMVGLQPTAGVGATWKRHPAFGVFPLQVTADKAKICYDCGRLCKFRLVLPGTAFVIYVVYGYTNSHTDALQREKN